MLIISFIITLTLFTGCKRTVSKLDPTETSSDTSTTSTTEVIIEDNFYEYTFNPYALAFSYEDCYGEDFGITQEAREKDHYIQDYITFGAQSPDSIDYYPTDTSFESLSNVSYYEVDRENHILICSCYNEDIYTYNTFNYNYETLTCDN